MNKNILPLQDTLNEIEKDVGLIAPDIVVGRAINLANGYLDRADAGTGNEKLDRLAALTVAKVVVRIKAAE